VGDLLLQRVAPLAPKARSVPRQLGDVPIVEVDPDRDTPTTRGEPFLRQ
jgi:hypothetical protein